MSEYTDFERGFIDGRPLASGQPKGIMNATPEELRELGARMEARQRAGNDTMPLCIWCLCRFSLIEGHPLNDACLNGPFGRHQGQ